MPLAPRPDALSWLTLATLRLYPRVWRRRYEDELRSHIEDHGASARDFAGLAWGALREHWRTPHGPDPAARPIAAWWWRGTFTVLRRTVIAMGSYAVAYTAGWLVREKIGPIADDVANWMLLVSVAATIPLFIRSTRHYRAANRTTDIRMRVDLRIRSERLGGIGVLILFAAWAVLTGLTHAGFAPNWPTLVSFGFNFVLSPGLDNVFDFDGRHRRMRDASSYYFGAREQLIAVRRIIDQLEAVSTEPQPDPYLIRQYQELARLRREMAAQAEILQKPHNLLQGPRA